MFTNHRLITNLCALLPIVLLCSCGHITDDRLIVIFHQHRRELSELHALLSTAPAIRYIDKHSILMIQHHGPVSRRDAYTLRGSLTIGQWAEYQRIEAGVGYSAIQTDELGTMWVQFDQPSLFNGDSSKGLLYDPFEERGALRTNLDEVRTALDIKKSGNALFVRVIDRKWRIYLSLTL